MKFLVVILLFFLLVVGVSADEVSELVKSGDKLFRVGKYEDALEKYELALSLSSKEAALYFKAGKVLNILAEDAVGKYRNDLYTKASDYLSRSLLLDSENPKAHIELARTLIKMGLLVPDWDNPALAKRIKEELDYAMKLDTKDPEGYYLLGLWHRGVRRRSILWRRPLGLAEASLDGELKNLRKAVDMDPENLLFRLEYAKSLVTAERNDEAKLQLDRIISHKPGDENEEGILKSANEILEKLGGKD
ncbi:hypothetical protein J7K18_00925 [bacterium]|nr:hypothetical protein [bacterium]